MAIYNVQDLLDRLHEIKKDGYSRVELSIIAADEEFPESLSFNAVVDVCEYIDYETVESVES